MRYAKIKYNDIANAPGVAVSFYTQGCPHHCPHCFNPETWDFNGGYEFTMETLESILRGLKAHGIDRSLCILGGEPLCDENVFLTRLVINSAKEKYPDTPIYIWTGYTIEELQRSTNPHLRDCLASANFLIDGPYIHDERDITLHMRGSRNQRIINLKTLTNEE